MILVCQTPRGVERMPSFFCAMMQTGADVSVSSGEFPETICSIWLVPGTYEEDPYAEPAYTSLEAGRWGEPA